jgi:DNA-binding transcriptional ArsR family regulator
MNMSNLTSDITDQMSRLLQAIASPARLEILLAIGADEACVCHLESVLGYRQAYISQHLMALRDAGVITARRHGRFVYYRLKDRTLLVLLATAGKLCGISPGELEQIFPPDQVAGCACPQCATNEAASRLQIELPPSIA